MNKPVDFTEEAKAILNMTSQSVGKDLLSALIDEIRTLPEPWHKLSEQKQADIIERCGKRVDYNVKRAVHLIASDGRIVVAGDVDQIVMKAQEDLKRIVGNSGLTGAALSSLDAFIDGLWQSDENAA